MMYQAETNDRNTERERNAIVGMREKESKTEGGERNIERKT